MPRKAEKLLQRMRSSAVGWTRDDLETLYRGYGFEIRRGSKHDMAVHSKYRDLRTTLPNHKDFAQSYVRCAVQLVTEVLDRDCKGGRDD